MKKLFLMILLLGTVSETKAYIIEGEIVPEYYYSEECPKDRPFTNGTIDSKGIKCVSCDYDEYGGIMNIKKGHEKYFDHCRNRITIRGTSYLKKKCPPEKPLQTVSGKCISCDQLEGDIIQDCSICSASMDILGRCHKCNYPEPFPSTEENCSKCPERKYKDGSCFAKICPEGYFMLEDGNCHHATQLF